MLRVRVVAGVLIALFAHDICLAASTPPIVTVTLDGMDNPQLVKRLSHCLSKAVEFFEIKTETKLRPKENLALHLFADSTAYENKLKQIGGEKFLYNPGYTSWTQEGASNGSFQRMFQSDPNYLKAVDNLPEDLLSLSVHELFHQYTHKADGFAPNRLLPNWYVEGQAEYMAHEFLLQRQRQDDGTFSIDPMVLSTNRVISSWSRDSKEKHPLQKLFGWNGLSSEENHLDYTYDLGESLYRFLQQPNSPWSARFDDFEKQLPQSQTADAVDQLMLRQLFGNNKRRMNDLEKDWLRYLQTDDDLWFIIYGSGQWRRHNVTQPWRLVTYPYQSRSVALVGYARPLKPTDLKVTLNFTPVAGKGKEPQVDLWLYDDARRFNDEQLNQIKIAIGNGYISLMVRTDAKIGWTVAKKMVTPNWLKDKSGKITLTVKENQLRAVVADMTAPQSWTLDALVPAEVKFGKQVYLGLGAYDSGAVFDSIETP